MICFHTIHLVIISYKFIILITHIYYYLFIWTSVSGA